MKARILALPPLFQTQFQVLNRPAPEPRSPSREHALLGCYKALYVI
jgi:hypothetical protein